MLFNLLLPLLAAPAVLGATTCNGHAELCDKSYGAVTFLGAHDSYAVGASIADNQNKDVTSQLNDGIRTLQVQTHNADDGIHLCHTSCSLLDGGLLSTYLSDVSSWVQSNPNDVITIVMVNIDNLPATSFTSAFESSSLRNHTYSPEEETLSINAWPTLGTLVDAGTTVIVFIDNQADFTNVPYIIDEFSNMWEDAYDVTTTDWGCAVNRSSGTTGSSMMLVNHFLDTTYNLGGTQFFVPNKDQINVTNSETSLTTHVGNCNSIWGRNPNHILLDFYDSNGNAPFNYVAQLNGVSAPTNVVSVAETASGSASASSGTASQTAVISQSSLGAGSSRIHLGWGSRAMGLGLGVGTLGLVLGGLGVFV